MIEYKNGFHLKGTDLWFDSPVKRALCFISSAGIEKIAASEKLIVTPETALLLGKKIASSSVLSCPYGRPFTLGNMLIELIPSGYIPGSAQIAITKNGKKIIYARDMNFRHSPTSAPAKTVSCDALALWCPESEPGHSVYPFESVIGSIQAFIDECITSGAVPVIFTEAHGMPQDIIKSLGDEGYVFSCHRSVKRASDNLVESGASLCNYELFKPDKLERKTVLVPISEIESGIISKIANKKTALVSEPSEDGLDETFKADAVFTLSTRASLGELLEFVYKASPETVYLAGPRSQHMGKLLNETGMEVIILERPEQMKLI